MNELTVGYVEATTTTTTTTTTATTAINESSKARQIGDKLRSTNDNNSVDREKLEDTIETITSSVNPQHTALKLKALGWGHTSDSNDHPLQRSEAADLLQEANLYYVLDEECNNARDETESESVLTYEGRIQADMMCTWQSQQDTCHGDSGGPIYLEAAHNDHDHDNDNDNNNEYVQVGIVSWGEDCADEVFPGVASRVSMSYEWIRRRVCSIDGTHPGTPTSFDCDSLLSESDSDSDSAPSSSSYTFSPAPSSSPSTQLEQVEAQVRFDAMELLDGSKNNDRSMMVDVTVEIHLDVFAVEQAWKIVDVETGIAIRDYPFGTYHYENYIQEHKIPLQVGHHYTFSIYDQYGDGITNNGYYQIYYSTGEEGEEEKVDLVPATEFTGKEQHDQFTVPSISTSTSTSTTTATIPTIPTTTSSLPVSSSTMAAFALVSSSTQTLANTELSSSQGRNGGSPKERLRKTGNPKDRSPP